MTIQKALREVNYYASRLIHSLEGATNTPETHRAPTIKLAKINIPTCDGNTLNWAKFWEQFELGIHCNEDLHDNHKLADLRNAVEVEPAKHVIKVLSILAGSYE